MHEEQLQSLDGSEGEKSDEQRHLAALRQRQRKVKQIAVAYVCLRALLPLPLLVVVVRRKSCGALQRVLRQAVNVMCEQHTKSSQSNANYRPMPSNTVYLTTLQPTFRRI